MGLPEKNATGAFFSALSFLTLWACAASESAHEPSVKPGINAPYLAEDLDVDAFVKRFEIESREIFRHRIAIATTAGFKAGMHIADVGAGTGLFTEIMARAVGPQGKVYAVDIVPRFIAHLERRARERHLDNVTTVLCKEDSVELPEASVDLVFLCDTYHHFEYPRATLASIRKALRPGGQLVVVDFERIPGVSSAWVLDHVRAGKDVVVREVSQAGFVLDPQSGLAALRENYFVRFKRP
jgi:predicted methyltransferase